MAAKHKRSLRARTAQRTGIAIGDRVPPRAFAIAMGMVVLVGAVVRIWAARGELWLDEIWSFRVVHLLPGPVGILTGLHHDNNHHLNSLYLYFLPETTHWMLYRLHSIVAGIGSIVLAATIARQAGRTAAMAAAVMTASSFFLVLYSSEARGYSLAIFFALLCVVLAERDFKEPRRTRGLAFAAAATLGICSHTTFLHAYAGLGLWTAVRALRTAGMRQGLTDLARFHALPLVAFSGLYAIDLQFIVKGGGPLTTIPEVMASALSVAFGGPAGGVGRTSLALGAALAGLMSLRIIKRAGSDLWILFAVAIFGAPIAMVMLADTSLLFERYFVVALTFLLLACSWTIAAISSRSIVAAAVLVTLYAGANARLIQPLLELGRGRYLEALADVAATSTRSVPTLGSDHDFRQGRVVGFHLLHMKDGDKVSYQPRETWAGTGPEWILVHSQDPGFTPKPRLIVEGQWPFVFTKLYPASRLSGWTLALYHNEADVR
jgi:hypothetical protein